MSTPKNVALMIALSEPSSPDPYRFELNKEEILIGKDPECDIVLSDTKVSRRHARIIAGKDGGAYVHDNKSTNGTYVNGHLITGEERIASHDVIRIVDYMIRVLRVSVDEEGDTDHTIVDVRRPVEGSGPKPIPPRPSTQPFDPSDATEPVRTAPATKKSSNDNLLLLLLVLAILAFLVGYLIL